MSIISMRLSGPAESIDAMLNALRGAPGVDHLVEMGAAEAPRMSDDSSSAGLPDDVATGGRDVELHPLSEAATRELRVHAEAAAHDAGVAVEWLEPL